MKQTIRLLMTLMLLMVELSASAQHKITGKLSNDGHTMQWSLSGATITKKGTPKFEKVNWAGTKDGNIKHEIEGTVAPGATLSAELKKVSGKNTPKIYIDFDYYTEESTFSVHPYRMIKLEDKDNISKSYTVPSNATEVLVMITYRTPDPKPRAYALEMKVVLRLKVKKSTPAPPPPPAKKDTCRMRKSKYEFYDLWGEVSIRCNDEDDDAYEFARLDDDIYENDRIRTKEESGAVLVWELGDNENPYHSQTLTIGEESVIVIPIKPRDPCEVRNDDGSVNWAYFTGKVWAMQKYNFKRMLEGREPGDPCEKILHLVLGVTEGDELPPGYDKEKIRMHYQELSMEQVYQIRQQIRWWNDHNNSVHQSKNANTYINTVYAVESQGSAVKVYMLNGFMPIVSEKKNAFYILNQGQSATVGKDGKIVVKKIDVNKVAKKFGITKANLQGNTTTTTGNAGLVFTADKLHYKILSDKTVEVTGEVRGTYTGSIKIPAKVKHKDKVYQVVGIGKQAFANQTKMTGVEIPTSIRGIAEDAFLNSGLTQVVIPGDQVSIVKNAFHNCQKLPLATCSGKKPQCSADAFNGCSAMKELRIRGISESNNGKKLNGTNAVIKVIK